MTRLWLYIDPGSGSMLWQLLLAGALGLVYQFRHSVRLTLLWVRGRFRWWRPGEGKGDGG